MTNQCNSKIVISKKQPNKITQNDAKQKLEITKIKIEKILLTKMQIEIKH